MAMIRYDQAALTALIRSPSGPVAQELLRRGRAVESQAKINCPVDQGRLRSSITHELVTSGPDLVVRIGTNVDYARYVHDGTGIYGPTGQPIRPKNARVLRWGVRKTTTRTSRTGRKTSSRSQTPDGFVFSQFSRGTPGRPFLLNALKAAGR